MRDDEKRGRLQGGSDRLAHINIAAYNRAINGRGDDGVIEIGLRQIHRGLLLCNLCFGLADVGVRGLRRCGSAVGIGAVHFKLLFADDSLRRQLLGALILALRLRGSGVGLGSIGLGRDYRSAGILQIGFRLQQSTFINRRVEFGDDLPLLDPGVEIREERGDRTGDLRAHLDAGDGVNGTGGFHHLANVSALDRRGKVLGAVSAIEDERRQYNHNQDNCCYDEPTFAGKFHAINFHEIDSYFF